MVRVQAMMCVVICLLSAGCGGKSSPTGDPSKKITWEQFQMMPIEEQADPYVLNNLDDEAKKKFDEMVKKKKR